MKPEEATKKTDHLVRLFERIHHGLIVVAYVFIVFCVWKAATDYIHIRYLRGNVSAKKGRIDQLEAEMKKPPWLDENCRWRYGHRQTRWKEEAKHGD